MSFAVLSSVPALAGAATVAAKAWSEASRGPAPLLSLQSNVLARQGEGVSKMPGSAERLANQRAGGIAGGKPTDAGPAFLDLVPRKSLRGVTRDLYVEKNTGTLVSSKGNIADILAKVPNNGPYGTGDYKRANTKAPKMRWD
eukprot:CAMPEP_0174912208 /NCGR_PEP_ID=MMETSP0167-20121228/79662_1 /TAXON_ID=38298 /ORGANISM="Rhodella maculata, Strain CCMP736" /LENGTH=141 /DNA_ID=CAMNT_0016156853 /DNA_START=17 /DNA_END=442 /DNA_ORIENTATION=+